MGALRLEMRPISTYLLLLNAQQKNSDSHIYFVTQETASDQVVSSHINWTAKKVRARDSVFTAIF